MSLRKSAELIANGQAPNLHEQYKDLAAEQLDQWILIEQKHQEMRADIDWMHAELIQKLISLK